MAAKKILIIAGTRPEIIKVAPVMLAARECTADRLQVKFCLTGQHKSMAQEALQEFGITPDADLQIMQPNQTINDISSAVFGSLPAMLDRFEADVVLVQGDTTTAAMSALAAFNKKIPVGHIEAGLRSFNLDAPYPEEGNRRLISCIARYNFCPTQTALQNLQREGVPEERLFLSGNTIVDALNEITARRNLDNLSLVHPRLKGPFILITAHRRESFGAAFENICLAIRESALKFPGIQFVYPVHLNPNVSEPVNRMLKSIGNVLLIPPVPYLGLLTLLKHCLFVLTDSGGIQEEAPSFRKLCVVMREVTERGESVQLGMSELVGTNRELIVAAIDRCVEHHDEFPSALNPYGDGRASGRIIEVLLTE